MTVYVDALVRHVATERAARRAGARHGHQWCHMFTDPGNESELHSLAELCGMQREWFQTCSAMPHYDLVGPRRERAVALGAVEVDRYQVVATIRAYRARAKGGG